jgi:hypothetical protein
MKAPRISLSGDNVNFVDVAFESLGELAAATVVQGQNWSPSLYSGNYRKQSNFLSMDIIGLDFDSGETTIQDAKSLFARYQHFITPTRSHLREKGGRVSERFRVGIVLNRPITDIDTYHATMSEVRKLCPHIDVACIDVARMFYPGTSVAWVNDIGVPFEVVAPTAQQITPKVRQNDTAAVRRSSADEQLKRLSRRTMAFLATGAQPGSWHHEIYAAARDLHEQQIPLGDAIMHLTRPTQLPGNLGNLDRHDLNVIEDAYSRPAWYPPRQPVSDNDRWVTLLRESIYYENIENPEEAFALHEASGQRISIPLKNVKSLLGGEFQTYEERIRKCRFAYEPRRAARYFFDKYDLPVFNRYEAPDWRRNVFLGDAAPPEVTALPHVAEEFLRHLVSNDEGSLSFLLDWMATSLVSRNPTYLVAIGAQGIGKGLLGQILHKLHGDGNYIKVRDEVLKRQFNGQLQNKTLVHIDEVALSGTDQHNRLKDFANETIEIEAKGKDALVVQNYASIYISSNHLDAVEIEAGDRRFSIIELTNIPIKDTGLLQKVAELLSVQTISGLGWYLLNRTVRNNMNNPFRSERFQSVREAGLSEWESYLFDKWDSQQGYRISIQRLKKELQLELGMKAAPGRKKLQDLADRFPERFKVIRLKGSERVLEFVKNNDKN